MLHLRFLDLRQGFRDLGFNDLGFHDPQLPRPRPPPRACYGPPVAPRPLPFARFTTGADEESEWEDDDEREDGEGEGERV